jgi:alcohol dehydrogenase
MNVPGSAVPVLLGSGALDKIGPHARALGGTRILLVTDPGIVAAGHVERAVASLIGAGMLVRVFDEAEENPTSVCVDKAVTSARDHRADLLVGLGGGSSMDCAKGCNFVLTNGGRIHDYQGVGKATKPMLPLVAIPTTAGTGSEAPVVRAHYRPPDASEDGLRRQEGAADIGDSRSGIDGVATR